MFLTLTILLALTGPINIAYGKPTEQGPKTYCESPNTKCHTANLAVNGYTTGNVSAGNCAHTTRNGQWDTTKAWWKVHFNGQYYLSSIKIYRRKDCMY